MKMSAYRARDAFAQVSWDMVKECGGDVVLAVIFDWIAFKCDASYDGVQRDGEVWYPVTVAGLAERTNMSPKVIRRALDELEALGHLESAMLRLDGPYDRTKSYRPLWTDESAPVPTPPSAQEGNSISPVGQIGDPGSAQEGESTAPTGKSNGPEGQMSLLRDVNHPPTPAPRGSISLPHPNIAAALAGKPLASEDTRICKRHKRQRATCIECWTFRPITMADIPWCGSCDSAETRFVQVDPDDPRAGVRHCPDCHPKAMTPAALENAAPTIFAGTTTRGGQGPDYAIPRGDREL